jgi:hypothetical protein
MHRSLKRRLVGGAGALLLIGATVLGSAGAVSAGQTRILEIKSPTATADGLLTFSQVGPGGATVTDVFISNNGKQNLTKAHLLIGVTGGVDLPSGITIADVFGLQGAGTCASTTTTLDCDFGSLTSKGPGKTRQVSIAFNVGATTSASAIVITIKVAETVQDVGSNRNFEQASGTPTVDAASCHTYTTYVVRVHGALALGPTSADCSGESQLSALHVPENSGNGFANYNDTTAASCTVGQLTCFGFEVNATVADGATISPYLIWEITYSAALMGNTNPTKVAFQHGTGAPLTFKKNTCGTEFDGSDCIAGYSVDPDTAAVTYTLWTAKNSTMRGLH